MDKGKSRKGAFLRGGTARWLWQAAGRKRCCVAILTVLEILLNIGTICYSLLFRDMIDRAVERQLSGFYFAVGALVALAAARLMVRALARWLEEYTRSGVENSVKHRFFRTLNRKSYACIHEVHTGEWMNRLTSDTVVVADGITQILPHLGGVLVRMAGAFSMIVVLEPLFGLVVVPAGLVFLAGARLLKPGMKRLHSDVQQADGNLRVLLQERLDNQLIVRAFDQQNRTLELANEKMAAHRSVRMKRNRFSNLYTTGFGTAMQGMYILGAVISCLGLADGSVSFGTMTAVLQLIGLLQSPLSEISGYFTQWFSMTASAERLMEAEAYPDGQAEKMVAEEEIRRFYQQEFEGISVEDVSFSYLEPGEGENNHIPSRITIQNLNLLAKKGEFVAITGSSGCGKSTLLKLLMGLYAPDSGEIRILRKQPPESRRIGPGDSGLFAYVPQGNQLMSGTIRQILAFDDPEKMKQDDQIWRALKIACADEFVAQLPEQLDAPLGEHGSGLSEGQIQRLALARALFSRRPVLLLDESTSALDEQTERQVLDNLRTMTDYTVLLVTHRPRACEICDRWLRFRSDETNTTGE